MTTLAERERLRADLRARSGPQAVAVTGFSGDRGRHRRASRWRQRGPYALRQETSREGAQEPADSRRPDGFADLTREGRADPRRQGREGRGDHRAEPREGGRRAGRRADSFWEGEQPRVDSAQAVTAPVVDRPQYIWRDFELDDEPPLAQPNSPDTPDRGDGLKHCGPLEQILYRQWDAADGPPSPDAVRAVDSLSRLPERLKALLAVGLDGIYVGAGGVPDLDDMGYLRGAPLPSGKATWDVCAGAYGDRKIVVGDRPSPTPDVMMHESGHALDDIDAAPGEWVSDSPEFVALYEECTPLFASTFHRQPGGLGRKEFFADAFAAIASRQRPALVDMLNGDTRAALNVMLFFNRRYGI
ncbi:hypothetical protein Skr01_32590 [Sphaerisporangium krabiense]|uniref:Uncharacterized protein n=1 Tax=Sphaerisporangium krabiense TaxID=763782 RepID=A0A7W8Z128_9ACTN|nr:hypothetical protein [Sphaerisporangium krabiense]MBB5625497.1 hypothetical protein [Sphaerisporangium krabiense]GII63174.1 hypothetical protein Skr01_32590 [Sphaerisporangium krabiense]